MTTTTSPGLAAESRVAYTSTKGKNVKNTLKPANPFLAYAGGMRKMGNERAMPHQTHAGSGSKAVAKGFAMGKKWASHHGPGGSVASIGMNKGVD